MPSVSIATVFTMSNPVLKWNWADIIRSFARHGVKKFLLLDGGVSTHFPMRILSYDMRNELGVYVAVTNIRGLGKEVQLEVCEQEEGGSCCGTGMENRYGGRLILINLLLNVNIPQTRRDSKSCYFLGEEGCLLQARHVICINYICRKITDRIDPIKISALREKEGEEVNLLFLLHEHVKKSLKGQAA